MSYFREQLAVSDFSKCSHLAHDIGAAVGTATKVPFPNYERTSFLFPQFHHTGSARCGPARNLVNCLQPLEVRPARMKKPTTPN